MARYIPKSKVNILETSTAKFVLESTNQIYIGTYMELSNGTFFAGNNPQNPGEKLLPIKPVNSSFRKSKSNTIYRKLKKPIYTELSKKSNIPITKPSPLIKDYEQGYFTRYFCRRVNDMFNYFEISKKTYNNLKSKNDKYDYNLYVIGEIKWALLETPINDINTINDNNIKLLLDQYPNLDIFFSNLNEYEPLHTRNFIEKLYYNIESKYTGYFHVHPAKGFIMEGPFHSTKPHKKLFTISQLQTKSKSSYVPSANPGTTQMGPTRGRGESGGKPSTSSGGSTSSGRSGY